MKTTVFDVALRSIDTTLSTEIAPESGGDSFIYYIQ